MDTSLEMSISSGGIWGYSINAVQISKYPDNN